MIPKELQDTIDAEFARYTEILNEALSQRTKANRLVGGVILKELETYTKPITEESVLDIAISTGLPAYRIGHAIEFLSSEERITRETYRLLTGEQEG
jgi:hypothetical protein